MIYCRRISSGRQIRTFSIHLWVEWDKSEDDISWLKPLFSLHIHRCRSLQVIFDTHRIAAAFFPLPGRLPALEKLDVRIAEIRNTSLAGIPLFDSPAEAQIKHLSVLGKVPFQLKFFPHNCLTNLDVMSIIDVDLPSFLALHPSLRSLSGSGNFVSTPRVPVRQILPNLVRMMWMSSMRILSASLGRNGIVLS